MGTIGLFEQDKNLCNKFELQTTHWPDVLSSQRKRSQHSFRVGWVEQSETQH
jgi:hypothetical protein